MSARLKLIERTAIGKGALDCKVKVRLPCQLEISDIAVFVKDGRKWATLPSEPMRAYDGSALKDDKGRVRYRSSLKWASSKLQDGFSEAVIAAVEAAHGPLGGSAP